MTDTNNLQARTSPSSSHSGTINSLSKYFCIPQRHIVYILCALAICIAYSLRISIEVAIVSQTLSMNETIFKNDTCPVDKQTVIQMHLYENKLRHNWSYENTKLFHASFYMGYTITQLPAGYLADKYGGKHLLTISIFGSSLCNFIKIGVLAFHLEDMTKVLILRICNGLFQGAVYPCVTAILVRWSPRRDRATISAFVYSAAALGYVMTKALGALIIYKTGSWKSILCFAGGLGLVWCFNWAIFCYASPEANPFIDPEEKRFLVEDLEGQLSERKKVPWTSIINSVPVWALIFAELGHDWGWLTVTHHLSQYLNEVLKLDVIHDEYWTAIPFAFVWVMSLMFGCLSDWLIYEQHGDPTMTRKAVVFASMLGPAVFIMLATVVRCQRDQATFVFSVAIALFGVFYPSAYANIFDLTPNFAGCVFGILNSFGAIMGIMSPIVIGMITPNSTMSEWQHIFWLTLFVLTIAALLYTLMGSAKEQEWNKQ